VKQCEHCHTIEKGGPHVFGPNLYSIFGQVSGQIPGSKASQIYKDKAITWTPGTMVCFSSWFRVHMMTKCCSLLILRIPRHLSLGPRSHIKGWRMSKIGMILLRKFQSHNCAAGMGYTDLFLGISRLRRTSQSGSENCRQTVPHSCNRSHHNNKL